MGISLDCWRFTVANVRPEPGTQDIWCAVSGGLGLGDILGFSSSSLDCNPVRTSAESWRGVRQLSVNDNIICLP